MQTTIRDIMARAPAGWERIEDDQRNEDNDPQLMLPYGRFRVKDEDGELYRRRRPEVFIAPSFLLNTKHGRPQQFSLTKMAAHMKGAATGGFDERAPEKYRSDQYGPIANVLTRIDSISDELANAVTAGGDDRVDQLVDDLKGGRSYLNRSEPGPREQLCDVIRDSDRWQTFIDSMAETVTWTAVLYQREPGTRFHKDRYDTPERDDSAVKAVLAANTAFADAVERAKSFMIDNEHPIMFDDVTEWADEQDTTFRSFHADGLDSVYGDPLSQLDNSYPLRVDMVPEGTRVLVPEHRYTPGRFHAPLRRGIEHRRTALNERADDINQLDETIPEAH